VRYLVVGEPDWSDDQEGVLTRASDLGFPLFTKPASLGSSVGITKVSEAAGLPAAIATAFRFERKIVIEQGVDPVREIEVAVLGNDDPVASVCGEIVPEGHAFYDYEAKYLDEHGARLVIPAPLEPALASRVQQLAVTAFTTIACAGMARVDCFVQDDTVWLNEINTIPGFTSISMYPKLWEASGLLYPDLVTKLLDLGIERFEAERAKRVDVPELHEGAERS